MCIYVSHSTVCQLVCHLYAPISLSGIGGSTISSLCRLGVATKANPDEKKLETTFDGVNLLVLDEVSMISCQMLSKISKNLNIAKSTKGLSFGGLDVLFAGTKISMIELLIIKFLKFVIV